MQLFICPACGQGLCDTLLCPGCKKQYGLSGNVPLLFQPADASGTDVTEIVKAFYEETPFPNYDDMDSPESLRAKAGRGVFARQLNEQIPRGARVLEVGCGTGQLSNFLGMAPFRTVIGADVCVNSLRLAEGFRSRFGIANVRFVQMNLFRPAVEHQSFDLVVSSGVLHHTADPRAAFLSIARLVKPGGFILIGLYNRIGRLTTDFRRWLFTATGDRLLWLDEHMRKNYNRARKLAWFRDQYKHPCEHKHTYDEVLRWFDAGGFEYVSSIPKIRGQFDARESIFSPQPVGTRLERAFTQLEILATGGRDGALFTVVGRKAAVGRKTACSPLGDRSEFVGVLLTARARRPANLE
jgi:ubiquinone/menaquinone biosynthesis C-methylase UbiE